VRGRARSAAWPPSRPRQSGRRWWSGYRGRRPDSSRPSSVYLATPVRSRGGKPPGAYHQPRAIHRPGRVCAAPLPRAPPDFSSQRGVIGSPEPVYTAKTGGAEPQN
jgi:hypothetical protein